MDDPAEAKKKDRNPNFPFIALDVALQRARVVYDAERRGAAPIPVLARHWSYSPASSGALQTAAALRYYGLMSDDGGSGSTRKLKLTELALRVLLDTRPNSSERIGFIRQAALSPKIAEAVHEKWPDELPSDATLSHFLVFDLGLSEDYAAKVCRILIKNQEFIRGFGEITLSPPLETALDMDSQTTTQAGAQGAVSLQPLTGTGSGRPLVARTEKVIDSDGIDITILFSGEPTLESYNFLKEYIELRARGLARKASVGKKGEAE